MEMTMLKGLTTKLGVAAVSAFLAGCVLFPEPYRATKYFDLGIPKRIAGAEVSVSSVTMEGPYKRKMAYRANGNELLFDEYNFWAAPPERMLSNYLDISLSNGDAEPAAKVSVRILTFEMDMASKKAVLTVEYTLERGGKKHAWRPTMTAELEEKTPEAFAKAMAGNAETLAAEIAEKAESLGKR
jgi:uncharacterized lipoprotein YmbA